MKKIKTIGLSILIIFCFFIINVTCSFGQAVECPTQITGFNNILQVIFDQNTTNYPPQEDIIVYGFASGRHNFTNAIGANIWHYNLGSANPINPPLTGGVNFYDITNSHIEKICTYTEGVLDVPILCPEKIECVANGLLLYYEKTSNLSPQPGDYTLYFGSNNHPDNGTYQGTVPQSPAPNSNYNYILLNYTGCSSSYIEISTGELSCEFFNGFPSSSYECPVKSQCWNNQLLLWYDNVPIPGPYALYFGAADPNNGLYWGRDPEINNPNFIPPSPNHEFILVEGNYSCSIPDGPPFVHLFADAQTGGLNLECTITNECSEVLEECGNAIVNYIDNVSTECLQWGGACNADYSLYRPGSVAIGTNNFHSGFQLTVKGGIKTERFKVENNGEWCDYVFRDSYSLTPLEKVKSHIEEKGHLHKMPSEAEIKQSKGYELSEMTLKQQEKIEEMFLHLIDMNKRVKRLSEDSKTNK